MNLVDRAKKIIMEPKNEWPVIEQENTPIGQLIGSYLIILALIPTVSKFIGYGFIGIEIPFYGHFGSISWGIRQAVVSFVTIIGGAFITAYIIDALAPSFGSAKNLNNAFALVVYSYTPTMVAGIFSIYPALSILAGLAGLYGLYLLYIGIAPMMKTPPDKVTSYFVVSLIVTIVVFVILSVILGAIFVGNMMSMSTGIN